MLAYVATKDQFLQDAPDIQDIVQRAVAENLGIHISPKSSEYQSWQNSLGYEMYWVLNDPAIPADAGVAIEYRLNGRRQRIDLMVSGMNFKGEKSLLVIELKQWTQISHSPLQDCVRTFMGGGLRDTTHPSYQAYSYASLLRNFYEAVTSTPIAVLPCAYAHNAQDDTTLRDKRESAILELAPLFIKGEREQLRSYISDHIAVGDSAETIRRIEESQLSPSKQLVESLASMLEGNDEFVLVDEQKIAFEYILNRVRSVPSNQKSVVIVEGGPGTGKSVIAVNALVKLLEEGYNARYVTKNAAPREVYRAKLSGKRPAYEIKNLFISSDNFFEAGTDSYDVVLVDEAHRLVKHSGFYRNLGENQMKEIIAASRISVFFLDESQHVTWRDIGSREDIEYFAAEVGAETFNLQLSAQFRCAGSDQYLEWVDGVLGFGSKTDFNTSDSEYELKVFDSPSEMRDAIQLKNAEGGSSRLLAGYCWEWKSKKDASLNDIEFPEDGFAMKWNLTEHGQAWMIAPDSVNQVGCIHTCQGLEGDYMGVIIGEDLKVENGQLIGHPENRAKSDKSLDGFKKAVKEGQVGAIERAGALVRKSYRTLFTRGMKGTYIYAADPEVRALLRNSIR